MLDVLGLNPGHFNRADEDHEDAHTVEVLVKGLLAERARARAAKDWEKSDRIRELLRSAGVEIQDAKGTPLP
jgi:cysteinyl-tRNA synthetase